MQLSPNLEMHGGNLGIISGSFFLDHKRMKMIFSFRNMHPKQGNLRIPIKILKNKAIEELIINIRSKKGTYRLPRS